MSWTEPQGQVGHLSTRTKADLQELLLRQEKILSNKRLIKTLPDKGVKIQEFAGKIRQALANHEEEVKNERLVSDFQSKYQDAFSAQQCSAQNTTSAASDRTPLNLEQAPETGLEEAMDSVTLGKGSSAEDKNSDRTVMENNLVKTPTDPPYLSVIAKSENTPIRKSKFKTNQLLANGSSPGPPSPGESGTPSPLTAEERRKRDRKHLDDITAAKLPPLHYSPVQLLSLAESAALLKEQATKQQELQAKLAAQKLSEGLKISMESYTPDSGPTAAYREVHDDGAQLSSEED
ncbi:unnamed protein product [Knipowitschia caucasica]